MKRKVSRLRLSPNEEARIIREEHERRRKLRIQQVREQQRHIALQIRQDVEQRRKRELELLEEELRRDWERQQREKINTLQKLYQESLQLLGQGHRSAKENEPDWAAIAQKEEENHTKAEERYREALKELKSQQLKDHERQSRSINARKKALEVEKERAAKVASLPPPPPNPIQNIDFKKPHVVKKSDVSAFSATHYHMSQSAVDREVGPEQPDAREEAELEARRLQDLQREEKRRREEHLEKARLRGKQALRREHLTQDRERLLVELEHMQQTDLLRRRQQVSKMPPQIFQPLYKRQETREDFQRELEFAFEDMYTGERRVKGDLVVQLVPEPLPALSTGSQDQDQELDVTLDEITPGTENTQRDTEREAGSAEQETSARVEPPARPPPRRALKKLLDRIRSQRNQWTEHNSHVPADDSPADISDQVPERDSTIDTGSLTSEEKDKQPPVEPPQAAHSPAAFESTEQSAAADASLPDVLASGIQTFTEERKRREEELERQKQQQVLLLQELEEQKLKLEQLLLEAQQEREHLKAAVTQEVPANQPEVPVRDQEVSARSSPSELLPPPDEHTRRIREYQQRLLEQNRIHQRSVEVARQRLEEYQRALRIRYNMTAPPRLLHPPPHSIRSVHLPAALPLATTPAVPQHVHIKPQTSAEIPARQSDTSASPPRPPAAGLTVYSGLLPDEEESVSYRNQRPDLSSLLADSIMERVTEHLPESARLLSVTRQPPPHKLITHHSDSIPLHPTPDHVPVLSPSTTDGAALLPGHAAASPHHSPPTRSLTSRENDMERQRRDLQEVQRRLLEQREEVALQQRQQEAERQRQEAEMEQRRRQKETLQALIRTDAQPVQEPTSEVSASINQTRLKLLASLLRAIEESNGGSLSHLEDPQEEDGCRQQPPTNRAPIFEGDAPAGPSPASALPSGLLPPPPPPPRAAKPPVTRVRLGVMDVMTEQHELSIIPEVETPANTSQVAGLEDAVMVHAADWDLQEESSVASDRELQTPSRSGSGQRTPERAAGSGTSSGRSSYLVWRERPLMGAGTPPESSGSDPRMMSPLSSDSGRGADCSGAAVTSYRSPTESEHRPPDSDCLSSTTISTGSYITTDPEQNLNSDKTLPLRLCVGPGADFLDVSSPSGQGVGVEDDPAAGRPGVNVEKLFNDSSIQRIIDKYTRELNISLNSTGKSADGGGSNVEEGDSLVSQPSLIGASEMTEDVERRPSLPSDAAQTRRSDLEFYSTVNPTGEDQSLAEVQEQDSFRPLIGQPADQSSYLAADHRDSVMEQLVGQPSAHSSMIGQRPCSMSLDPGGWDSTLSRMIGRLTRASSSHWLSGGQDFYAGQLMGQMASEQSSAWLGGGPEQSGMRLLVGELDESTGSDERTRVDFGVSTEAGVPSLPPEASSHSASPRDGTLQDRARPMDRGPDRTEVFPDSDSFHPLLAEVTHNETAEPPMTFDLPEHHVPTSPAGQAAGRDPTPEDDRSVESEASPERLRTEDPSGRVTPPPAFHESPPQLVTSHIDPHESALMAELTALTLSDLTVCDDALSELQPIRDVCAGELKSEAGSNLRNVPVVSEKILDAAGEKGILEQSEITLLSLTDTTLQDEETTIAEEDERPAQMREEEQTGQETQEESMMLLDQTPEDQNQTPAVLLEIQFGPGRRLQDDVCQQKRRALLQRSAHRAAEIKARRAKPEARDSRPSVSCKPKSEPQRNKTTGGQAEKAGVMRQTNVQLPPPDSRMKKVEVKICTTEQRKLDVSEMHQRTQRLYEQLEEVKHQKAIRRRQEASAQNRLKAKEFHQKTLRKLRAKQTPQ